MTIEDNVVGGGPLIGELKWKVAYLSIGVRVLSLYLEVVRPRTLL